jgi:hypothetical protein
MKTRDCPLFVGIAPATLRGGLCLAALITLAKTQLGPAALVPVFWKQCRELGRSSNPLFIL